MSKIIEKIEDFLELGGIKKNITLLIISGIAVILSLLKVQPFSFDIAWFAIVLCGLPIVLEAAIGLITSFDIKADVLVAMALIASLCIGETFAAGEVAFIMQLGELLEDLTVERARSGIEKLVHLTPQTARVLHNDKEEVVSATQVKVGDRLRVLPGESVPVDGVIISGQTSINQAVMTGESLPVDKTVGDAVSSGTVNQFGAFEMEATKVGEDSSIQRMIQLVQSADAGKAKIVGLADRWATWVVLIAFVSAALAWIITGQIIRAVTILVVFCPCSLVLATPTAIMAAIGNASKHGFLVRMGDALERLAKVKVIAFDKTGTLTYGTPEVVSVGSISTQYSQDDIYRLTASAEQLSEHPLGKAIVRCAKNAGMTFSEVTDFQMMPGRGVSACCDGKTVLAGNLELLKEQGMLVDQAVYQNQDVLKVHPSLKDLDLDAAIPKEAAEAISRGCTVTYVAIDGEFAGFIALSDAVREESPATIAALSQLEVRTILLTGDHKNAAQAISDQLHISEVQANCLPEDKLKHIGNYQSSGLPVCMIGDGINDAPALKKANVGIALGGVGSDIAVDAADIALVDDNIKELPHLIGLSRHMMTTIIVNMTFSMTLNFVSIALAIIGTLNPIIGALVHNAGSVLVIANSALLLGWRRKKKN